MQQNTGSIQHASLPFDGYSPRFTNISSSQKVRPEINDVHILCAHTGAFVSMISCAIIVLSYSRKRKWRRHPNPLMYWKAVVDLIYAVRFQFNWDQYLITGVDCRVLGIVTEALAVSSECWFLNMSIDLYQCSTNPFTNLKQNMIFHHWFAWTTGSLVGLGLWFSDLRIHNNGRDSDCSIDSSDTESLLVYYGIVIICVISAVAFSVLEKRSHTFAGMREALNAKRDVIRSARISTITYLLYQVVVISLWIAYVIAFRHHHESIALKTRNALSFSQASKGLIDLIIWLSVNNISTYWRRRRRSNSCTIHGIQIDEARHTESDDVYSDIDIDLEPQLNVALRKEVLHFATRGIVAASSNVSKLIEFRKVAKLRLHEFGMSVQFDDYHPSLFRDIREGFGIKETLYRKAFLTTCHERIHSGGSSGAFMFYTADYSYIVKTVTHSERSVLLRMLPAYIKYMKANPLSHLTRFYGCHSIKMYRQTFSFVVMGNVIGKVSMHQFFDIKGSWINRNAKPIPPGKILICTYCSHPFRYGSNENCEYSIHGTHLPHVVLKDNDFHRKVRLVHHTAQEVVDQLESDSRFLCSFGIMDYSLLLSTHSTKYVVDQASFDVSRIFTSPSKRKVNAAMCHRSNTDSFLSTLTGDGSDVCRFPSPNESVQDEDEPDKEHEQEIQNLQEIEYHNRLTFNRTCRVSLLASAEETIASSMVPKLSARGPERIPVLLHDYKRTQHPPAQHCYGSTGRSKDINAWIGRRTVEMPGYLACAVVGPDYYTFGIIDILQTWTWQKQIERWWKIYVLRCDGYGISAAPPRLYAERFQRKMRQIMMISVSEKRNLCISRTD